MKVDEGPSCTVVRDPLILTNLNLLAAGLARALQFNVTDDPVIGVVFVAVSFTWSGVSEKRQ